MDARAEAERERDREMRDWTGREDRKEKARGTQVGKLLMHKVETAEGEEDAPTTLQDGSQGGGGMGIIICVV